MISFFYFFLSFFIGKAKNNLSRLQNFQIAKFMKTKKMKLKFGKKYKIGKNYRKKNLNQKNNWKYLGFKIFQSYKYI